MRRIALDRRRPEPQLLFPPISRKETREARNGTTPTSCRWQRARLMETETFLMLAVRLKYITQAETSTAFTLVTEVSKMLTSLRSRLERGRDQR